MSSYGSCWSIVRPISSSDHNYRRTLRHLREDELDIIVSFHLLNGYLGHHEPCRDETGGWLTEQLPSRSSRNHIQTSYSS
jgi:hypothetical protein